jgi:hypothetical protein
LIPLSTHALMASALCRPVIAGGIRPLLENFLADEMPDC